MRAEIFNDKTVSDLPHLKDFGKKFFHMCVFIVLFNKIQILETDYQRTCVMSRRLVVIYIDGTIQKTCVNEY